MQVTWGDALIFGERQMLQIKVWLAAKLAPSFHEILAKESDRNQVKMCGNVALLRAAYQRWCWGLSLVVEMDISLLSDRWAISRTIPAETAACQEREGDRSSYK